MQSLKISQRMGIQGSTRQAFVGLFSTFFSRLLGQLDFVVTSQGLSALAEALSAASTTIHLSIEGNRLYATSTPWIAKLIQGLPGLETLRIGGCLLGEGGCPSINLLGALEQTENLKALSVARNRC